MKNEVTELAGPLESVVCSCKYVTGTVAHESVTSDISSAKYASPAYLSATYSCLDLYSDLMYNFFSQF